MDLKRNSKFQYRLKSLLEMDKVEDIKTQKLPEILNVINSSSRLVGGARRDDENRLRLSNEDEDEDVLRDVFEDGVIGDD